MHTELPLPVLTCAAISKRRIETAIGQRVQQSDRHDSGAESTCTYSSGDAAVTIAVTQLSGGFDIAAELENLKAAFPGSRLSELPALGERAFALELEGAGVQLHLISRQHEYLLISVLGVRAGHQGLEAATQLARDLMRNRP